MRNLLFIYTTSIEKKFAKSKKKFRDFFFKFSVFIKTFFNIFWRQGWDEGERGVGERSEPSAGGLAVGAEGSVNSEFP